MTHMTRLSSSGKMEGGCVSNQYWWSRYGGMDRKRRICRFSSIINRSLIQTSTSLSSTEIYETFCAHEIREIEYEKEKKCGKNFQGSLKFINVDR